MACILERDGIPAFGERVRFPVSGSIISDAKSRIQSNTGKRVRKRLPGPPALRLIEAIQNRLDFPLSGHYDQQSGPLKKDHW